MLKRYLNQKLLSRVDQWWLIHSFLCPHKSNQIKNEEKKQTNKNTMTHMSRNILQQKSFSGVDAINLYFKAVRNQPNIKFLQDVLLHRNTIILLQSPERLSCFAQIHECGLS